MTCDCKNTVTGCSERPDCKIAERFNQSSRSEACCIAPWMMPPLNEWAIVGMNHYHVDGKRHLFVSMEKDGRCIKSEGADDKYLWNRLWHLATEQ